MSSAVRALPPSLAPVVAALEFDPPDGPLTLDELARVGGVPRERARLVASRLAERGWLKRVKRGLYEFVPAAQGYPSGVEWHALAGVSQELLVSGLTAARAHALTPQLATRHLVVMRTDRAVPRLLIRSELFRVARLRPWRVFGAEPQEMDGVPVPLARLERLLLDAIQRPGWFAGAGEAARIITRGLPGADRDLLVSWAERWRSHVLMRRLGWWGERVLGADVWSERERARLLAGPRRGERVGVLVPGEAANGRPDPTWGVVINVSEELLRSEEVVR